MSDVTLLIDQLVNPLSPRQIRDKIYDVLARLNVSTTNWKPGGVVRLMIAACSVVLAGFSVVISLIARSAFLTMSTGAWLTLVARHVFGVEREVATFASGNLTLQNSEAVSRSYDADEVLFANPTTGKTYRNTSAFTIGASATLDVAVHATEAGAASSSGVGTVTKIVSPAMLGITCTNLVTLIGTDDQSDESLIAACLLKPTSLSPNGARGAYETFAKQAKRLDGTSIGVNRVAVSNSSLVGVTTVTVATPSGEVTGTQSDPSTDLGAVYQYLIENCLPGCVTLVVQSAEGVLVNVAFWAYFRNMVMTAGEQERIAGPAVEQWFTGLKIGGTTIPDVMYNKVPRDTLRDVIAAAFPTRPELVVIISPSTDLTLDALAVAEIGSITARAA